MTKPPSGRILLSMMRRSVLNALQPRARSLRAMPSPLVGLRFSSSYSVPPPGPAQPKRLVTIDRPLPDVLGQRRQQRIYFTIFCAVMAISLFGMVKYEAANSPIVTSTLFALRRSELVTSHLGHNIRFTSTMPWVTGSTGIAKDVVDFSYDIVGDAGSATVHFRSEKVKGESRYAVTDWSITPHQGPSSGKGVSLIDEEFLPHVPLSNTEEPGVRRNPRG